MSERLVLVLPTQRYGKWAENHASWGNFDVPRILVEGIRPLTAAYQHGYEEAVRQYPDVEVLAFVHDDVTVYDPQWKERVLHEFDDPSVGLCGFGGSTGHGALDIYRSPYDWTQVAREGTFMSNLVNAELHGSRVTDAREAKCLDGFAMFVRRGVLNHAYLVVGSTPSSIEGTNPVIETGWPQNTPIAYWAYDYWLSCETRRQGLRIRVVGVACEHTCPGEYRSYVVDEDCQAAHKWLYDNYRDTFPARCGGE